MAAGKSTTTVEVAEPDFDEADTLFGEGGGLEVGEDEFAGADDLLNEVEEDDSEGWNPAERGEKISGVIVKIGETKSDFAQPGQDPMVPTVTIQTREGKFRVIGYGSVLRRELEDNLANGLIKIGNLMAVAYWGEKPIKRGPFAGKNYRHYTVVARPPAVKKP